MQSNTDFINKSNTDFINKSNTDFINKSIDSIKNPSTSKEPENTEIKRRNIPTCPRCSKEFRDKYRLKTHMRHVKCCIGILYACKRCYMSFDKISDLDKHQRNTRTPCVEFKLDQNDMFGKKSRTYMKRKKKRSYKDLEETIIFYMRNMTGTDDPIRTPQILQLYDLLTNEEFLDVTRKLYKKLPEYRSQLATTLKTYKVQTDSDRVSTINKFYKTIRKPTFK
jgi:hypothetical protein